MEVIVATLIATLTITALAYTFGTGRGLIDRYEIARVALGRAQGRIERLSVLPTSNADLSPGMHGPQPFVVNGTTLGNEAWRVDPMDDPVTPIVGGLRRVTVIVAWTSGGLRDTVRLDRVLLSY